MIKQITWTAKEETGFKGEVVLNALNYVDKMKALKELNLKTNASGEVELSVGDQMDSAVKIYELLSRNIVSMSLEHSSGEIIKDLDSLGMVAEGSSIIPELGGLLIKGISLGKN
jgi:hypothetical protein